MVSGNFELHRKNDDSTVEASWKVPFAGYMKKSEDGVVVGGLFDMDNYSSIKGKVLRDGSLVFSKKYSGSKELKIKYSFAMSSSGKFIGFYKMREGNDEPVTGDAELSMMKVSNNDMDAASGIMKTIFQDADSDILKNLETCLMKVGT